MSGEDSTDNVNLNFLIVTANVGTLFEDPEGIQDTWLKELYAVVSKHRPKFIALHCQEIGGKDYKTSLDPVNAFFNKVMNCDSLSDFTTVRGYLDGDFDHVDQYTALGNFYFVHKSVTDATLYDFTSEKFTKISGKEIFFKDICSLPHVKKEKFEQDFFPDCKWSRKGYCRVRWRFNEKVIDFVNIHLFHDDNNLVSIKSSPSPYTAYRSRALEFVLQRLKEQHPVGLYFMCGDFNFRLDVKQLVQTLFPSSHQQVVRADDEIIRIIYRDNDPDDTENGETLKNKEIILKIEKKLFKVERSLLQQNSGYGHLRHYDIELGQMKNGLKEFNISFAPTYPFSENTSKCSNYMETRCPSWCDRILLSNSCWEWIHAKKCTEIVYSTIGDSVCMGDHKPVYLHFNLPIADVTQVTSDEKQNGGNKCNS